MRKSLELLGQEATRRQIEQSRLRTTHSNIEEEKDQKIRELNHKLEEQLATHLGEMECLKIKLEQLREADVQVLLRTLESRVS
jgi:hypothetical protein